MSRGGDETRVFRHEQAEPSEPRRVLTEVYGALREKGYNPIGQLAGYLASGEPVYVTAHKNARSTIRKVDRLELLEELLRHYLER